MAVPAKKPNLNHMVSHGLSPLELRFKGLYFVSYKDLAQYVQHKFSDHRCDTVVIRYEDNLFTRGAAKIKSQHF